MKILIPVDGSAHANAALDFVASRATLLGQEPGIALINVQSAVSVRVTRAVGREEVKAYQRAPADEVLRPALDRLKRAGVAASGSYALGDRSDTIGAKPVRLCGGAAGDAIAAYARKRRLDALVMGSHGHGAFKALVLGSVAMRVAARCHTPLLLIRAPARADD